MTENQIKQMAERFLGWKLPADFHPDAGVVFTPVANAGTQHEYHHTPTGTNLFNYTQATEMVRHMVGRDLDWFAGDEDCDGNPLTAIPTDALQEVVMALQLARSVLANSGAESGVCMCGDPVDGHSYGSGHSPVDSHQYVSSQAVDQIDAALTRLRRAAALSELAAGDADLIGESEKVLREIANSGRLYAPMAAEMLRKANEQKDKPDAQ